MKAVLVSANPKKDSLCSLILKKCLLELDLRGFDTVVRDLYDPLFNPVLSSDELYNVIPADVFHEQSIIVDANVLVVIHPVWWFGAPSILKGWYDRILIGGFAFDFKDGVKVGKLNKLQVLCLQTAGSEFSMPQDSMNVRQSNLVWKYCGILNVNTRVFLSSSKMLEETDIDLFVSDGISSFFL